jgi:hypothetical protein
MRDIGASHGQMQPENGPSPDGYASPIHILHSRFPGCMRRLYTEIINLLTLKISNEGNPPVDKSLLSLDFVYKVDLSEV